MADARGLHGQHELERELAPGKRSSDLSRSLGAEQQEQEHTSIALTTCRCRSLECRGLTRVPCRRDDRRRRSRDSPSGVAPGTQREQGNKNMGDDETEVPACQAAFSLAPTPPPRRKNLFTQHARAVDLLFAKIQPSRWNGAGTSVASIGRTRGMSPNTRTIVALGVKQRVHHRLERHARRRRLGGLHRQAAEVEEAHPPRRSG